MNYQAIQKDIQARSNDQGQIWDDQGLDPGRGSGHGLILGDPPLTGCPIRSAPRAAAMHASCSSWAWPRSEILDCPMN